MRPIVLLVSLFAAVFLSPTCLRAQEPPAAGNRQGRQFDGFDADGNGRLGPDELRNENVFRQMDTDGDGWVTREEASRWRPRRARRAQLQPEDVPADPVFPADPAAVEARNRRLEGVRRRGEEPTNVVLILADDMGYGDLGCYGRRDIATPNLDRLAAQGVRFTNHYANGAECTPTRTALLTGRYQQWVGGLECAIGTGNVGRYDDAIRLREKNDLGLPTDQQTIVRLLKDAGYETALTGKWHLGYEPKFAPNLHGFDETFYCIGGGMDYFHYLDTVAGYNLFEDGQPISGEGYFTDMLTDRAIAFVRREHQAPFFLYVPYTCPHSPFQGPDDWREDPLPLDSPLWNQGSAPPDVYIAMIEHMDRRIGDLLAALDERGLTDQTVVFFASDNGGTKSARNAPFSGHKGSTWEGGIRVPGIVRWPGVIPAGTVSDQPCLTFDFTASIAKIAGVTPDPEMPLEGIDIVGHVAEGREDFPRTLYWRKPRGETVWKGVRQGTMKFVAQTRDGEEVEAHLFDLAVDPAEKNDLSQSLPEEFDRLRNLFDKWEETTRRNRRGRPE